MYSCVYSASVCLCVQVVGVSSVASANDEIAVIRYLLQHQAELFECTDHQPLVTDDELSITSTDAGSVPLTQQVP